MSDSDWNSEESEESVPTPYESDSSDEEYTRSSQRGRKRSRKPGRKPGRKRIKVAANRRTVKPLNVRRSRLQLEMPMREVVDETDDWTRARRSMHVSSVPETLPGREDEFDEIYLAIEGALGDSGSSSVFVSGTPGTGKSATVFQVVRQLEKQYPGAFTFVEINGMRLTHASHAYVVLWEALSGQTRVAPATAHAHLEREFNPGLQGALDRVPCIVMLDEMDRLVTNDQRVMYNFFNWPNMPDSRMIVIGIANTMDLPERILSSKITSRMGLHHVTFGSYTYPQLESIIKARLLATPNLIDNDAIALVSRKIASGAGDARRALEICRRALERAQQSQSPQVTTKLVINTMRDMDLAAAPTVQYISSLPWLAKVYLAAMIDRAALTGIPETSLEAVSERVCMLIESRSPPQVGNILERRKYDRIDAVVQLLANTRLVHLDTSRGRLAGKIRLAVLEEDVKNALQNDILIRAMVK